ncbi:hypothetical protein ACJJTC_014125 [Scirpophaga incertulas]
MIRVNVYRDFNKNNGMVMVVEDSLETFKSKISTQFGVPKENIKLFSSDSCEIIDIRVIRDNESLYLSKKSDYECTDCDRFKNISVVHTEKNSCDCRTISEWITLNVGGKHFRTTRSTLVGKEPLSMLARMFAEENKSMMNPSSTDIEGAFLIDRSPQYFEPILNYLRHGDIILDNNVNPRGVLAEATFYGIDSMIPHLNKLIDDSKYSPNSQALTRMDVVRAIIMTPTNSELRFQGVNLAGADLSRLDLRYINFKYACLSRCNLGGTNLSYCCLERADLSHANLELAQLLGVKALCANMEGANLKGCNMEDPVGSRAIMEGVNLKGANLEGSNMAGVNLRVATLKNANLQNCDLRAAVLAGADLESCDLSGSDLQEANLRGANLKDAAFELMLTPLHMSQTIR